MKKKLQNLIKNLNHGLVEREEIIKLSLLTMLSKENLILIGPPGTAKSEISRRLAKIIKNGEYFEYLFTKFTTPDEIFGPLSIKALKDDRFKRNTDGYMPTSNIAFLDEIFKANSSILNSLLTVINEGIFHNGNQKEEVPLISLLGASNELPVNDDELKALYDRFLVKMVVDYVEDKNVRKLLDLNNDKFSIDDKLKLGIEDIKEIHNSLGQVTITDNIKDILVELKSDFKETFKDSPEELLSDRKFIKILNFLKVSAYTNDRKEVDSSDILLLRHCFWNNPDNKKELSNLIINILKSHHDMSTNDSSTVVIEESKIIQNNNSDFRENGSEKNPFLIESINDLLFLSDNSEYFDENYFFKQTEELDFQDTKYYPIGTEENPFKGSYNGNNKSISNLKIEGFIHAGLFGKTVGANIKNIVLKNINYSKSEYVGGIVGYMDGGTINNSYININTLSSSSMVGKSSSSSSGGVVGRIDKIIDIKNCYISDKMKITGDHVSTDNRHKIMNKKNLDEKFFQRMGWDFVKIWIWDTTKGSPILRMELFPSKGGKKNIPKENIKLENIKLKKGSTLTQQIKANIWLM